MREPDNPFEMREAEQIENEATFLKLFGHGMLDLVTKSNLMNKPTLILSAPGGGKTSLMRVFTPQSLVNIYSNRTRDDDYKELYHTLEEFEVVAEGGPSLLGIYLSCAANYSELEDLELEKAHKDRLFFSLLNARLISNALSGLLYVRNLEFTELDRITISKQNQFDNRSVSLMPSNGRELYEYASKMERKICKGIDSFDSHLENGYAPVSDLEYFFAFDPRNIMIDGKPAISNTLVMLDDMQILSKSQRNTLLTKLDQQRVPIPVWIAERKEALEFSELLPGQIGRDFQILEIESHFRDSAKKYESFVLNVADRRARASPFGINNFNQCIDDSLESQEWEPSFLEIIGVIRKRIETIAIGTKAYNAWIEQQENEVATPRERAIGWRTLEIRIRRHQSGGQQLLIDEPLSVEEISNISGLKAAAEFFLCDEFKIPYYFGLMRLAALSAFNIQQYIGVASDLFDKSIAKWIMKKRILLSPQMQEDEIKKIARTYWNSIPTRTPYGTYASNLLQSIGKFARSETMRETAPYLPGVTGIGLTSQNYDRIADPSEQKTNPEYEILHRVLHACIANNILLANFDYKQGPKGGDSNVVLNFNRLLCVHFGLPLGYGGWRKTNPEELAKWLELPKMIRR